MDDRWTVELPGMVSTCAERWGLVVRERLSGGLVAHVFACETRSGDAGVLKLVPPSAADYAGTPEQEAAALRAWAGRGAVELWEFAPDLGALLTRRALPGARLEGGDDAKALRRVAAVLATLFGASLPPVALPPLGQAVDRYLVRKMTLVAERERVALKVPQARVCAAELAASAVDETLLHGDVMDKNLVRDGRRFLAIDPMPCIGDPHSDIGFWAATRAPVRGLDRRAAALARLLGFDPERAARWAAVYAVGQACETWRTDTAELRDWARSTRAQELLLS